MQNKDIFLGIVTEVIDEHSFIFRSDNNIKCQIGQVVGLRSVHENIYVLACIGKIHVDYFLKNTEEYFTSIASDNKLRELSKGNRSPKYSQRITANLIGIYEYHSAGDLFYESNFSIDSFTPDIFQEVVGFNFNYIETVYGLRQNREKFFKLGTFLYPNYSGNKELPDVNISTDTFKSHTLISGVTGSGKSRLTAHITNQLALNGAHITIIDPHNEYIKFADTGVAKVSFISKDKQVHENRNDVSKRGLSFSNSYLVPQIISKLLPELSEQQIDYVYEVFEKNNSKRNYSIKTIVDSIIQDFNFEFKAGGLNSKVKTTIGNDTIEKDKLTLAQEYAKKDSRNDIVLINRFLFCLSNEINTCKVGRLHVIYAVLKKMLTIYEADFFPINLKLSVPAWLDMECRNSINIMNFDYDSNTNIRRFINAIIQSFFVPISNNVKYHRTLIVDEAHLLLNDKSQKSDTSILLSRLLRESRKFGLSIIFITQNEIDVPEEIKGQFQNRFKFREENNIGLKYLDNQTCLCSLYKGKLSFPMRVDNVEEFAV